MEITKQYLQGVVDALYNSQTPLLGGEIEEEKNFEIKVTGKDIFFIELSCIESFKQTKFENDLNEPNYYVQEIYVKNTKIDKLVKDIITEMETIYNLDCPTVEVTPIKEYVGVI